MGWLSAIPTLIVTRMAAALPSSQPGLGGLLLYLYQTLSCGRKVFYQGALAQARQCFVRNARRYAVGVQERAQQLDAGGKLRPGP